jgi:hypothetical protein
VRTRTQWKSKESKIIKQNGGKKTKQTKQEKPPKKKINPELDFPN